MGDRKAPTPFPGNQVRPSPPPAPPAPVTTVTNADYDRWLEQERAQLRDEFAKAALSIAHSEIARQMGEGELVGFGWDAVARDAYRIADAMLTAREAK